MIHADRMVDGRELRDRWNRGTDRQSVLDTICRNYSGKVYKQAIRMGLSHEDAEDIVQECLIAFAQQDEINGIGKFLETVARNKSSNLLRSRANSLRRAAWYSESTGASMTDPAKCLLNQELITLMENEVKRLDARESRLLTLRYIDGHPASAVAREMGVSRRTFYNLHDSTIKKLRNSLRKQGMAPALVMVCLKHFESIPVPDGLEQRVINAVNRAVDWNHSKNAIRRNHPWARRAVGACLIAAPIIIAYFSLSLFFNQQPEVAGERVVDSEARNLAQDVQITSALAQPISSQETQSNTANGSRREVQPNVEETVFTVSCIDEATGNPVNNGEVYLVRYNQTQQDQLIVSGRPMFYLYDDTSSYMTRERKPVLVPRVLEVYGPFYSNEAGIANIHYLKKPLPDEQGHWALLAQRQSVYDGFVKLDSLPQSTGASLLEIKMRQIESSPVRLLGKQGVSISARDVLLFIRPRGDLAPLVGARIFPKFYVRAFDDQGRMDLMFDESYGFTFIGTESVWSTLDESAQTIVSGNPVTTLLQVMPAARPVKGVAVLKREDVLSDDK